MKCISCRTDMNTTIIKGYEINLFEDVEIDYCPNCESVWLDQGEFEKVSKLNPGDYEKPEGLDSETTRILNCPCCSTEMELKGIQNVEIDYCSDCNGIWLDKDELTKLSYIDPKTGYDTRIPDLLEYFQRTKSP